MQTAPVLPALPSSGSSLIGLVATQPPPLPLFPPSSTHLAHATTVGSQASNALYQSTKQAEPLKPPTVPVASTTSMQSPEAPPNLLPNGLPLPPPIGLSS